MFDLLAEQAVFPMIFSVITETFKFEVEKGHPPEASLIELYLSKEPAYAKEMKRLANKQRQVAIRTGDPRFTGDIDIFQKTRWYVQERKRGGYKKRVEFPE